MANFVSRLMTRNKEKISSEQLINSVGTAMFVTGTDLTIKHISQAALGRMGYKREEVVGKMTCADLCQTPLCGTQNCAIKNCMQTGQTSIVETVARTKSGESFPAAACCSAVMDENGNPAGGIEVIFDQTNQKNAVAEIKRLAEAARQGQLDRRADLKRGEGDFKILLEELNRMMDAILSPIKETLTVLEKIAHRDLTTRVKGDFSGEHAKMKYAINTAVQNLDSVLSQAAEGAEQVASASVQISSGSEVLAQVSSEQASSLEEVSSSLQEMASMTNQNAANSQKARKLAEGASMNTQKGVENMKKLSEAIALIKSSSDETAKIVKTIDEIAFQTNLLALNAAVEAARAGDAGKGFAIVAEEVRNLAIRSAEAAKTTASLIEDSIRNSEGGVELNREAMRSLEEINEQAYRVSSFIGEIAAASEQQRAGIDQINTAVQQINQVTSKETANAEESASAAEELSSQAEGMKATINLFRLKDGTAAPGTVDTEKIFAESGHTGQTSKRSEKIPNLINGPAPDPAAMIPFEDDESILREF